jgi:hypothetical protein
VNDLGKRTVDQGKAGAKNVVTTNDFVNRALQQGNVEGSGDPKAHGDVPAGISRLKAVKIPKGLLRDASGETVERLAE